jgi:hypothetical protein
VSETWQQAARQIIMDRWPGPVSPAGLLEELSDWGGTVPSRRLLMTWLAEGEQDGTVEKLSASTWRAVTHTEAPRISVPLDDYTIGEVLAEIGRQEPALVLTGTGSLLALIGSAMLERLGMKPEGMAEVTATIDNATEITIRWPG